MLGACTISQHLSVIFVFLATFTRLLDHTLDPRLLVVLSSVTFVAGCIIWESMEYFESDAVGSASSDRRTLFRLYSATGLMMTRDLGARGQGIPAHLLPPL